eukprot:scaffold19131_cov62-Attheya_sp.AAC.1
MRAPTFIAGSLMEDVSLSWKSVPSQTWDPSPVSSNTVGPQKLGRCRNEDEFENVRRRNETHCRRNKPTTTMILIHYPTAGLWRHRASFLFRIFSTYDEALRNIRTKSSNWPPRLFLNQQADPDPVCERTPARNTRHDTTRYSLIRYDTAHGIPIKEERVAVRETPVDDELRYRYNMSAAVAVAVAAAAGIQDATRTPVFQTRLCVGERIRWVRVPVQSIDPDASPSNNVDSIWWPALLYKNHEELLEDLTDESSQANKKLAAIQYHHFKTKQDAGGDPIPPVARLILSSDSSRMKLKIVKHNVLPEESTILRNNRNPTGTCTKSVRNFYNCLVRITCHSSSRLHPLFREGFDNAIHLLQYYEEHAA